MNTNATLFASILGLLLFSSVSQAEYSLAPITVTASRLSDIQHIPASVTVISAEAIANSSATNLPDLLSEYAGLSQTGFFNHSARTNVGIRSFGETATQNTLILLNGRRLNDNDLSPVNYAAIAIANIERIEITRGSGSILYGDGATTGAINIITRHPAESENTFQLSQTLGSSHHRESNAFMSYDAGGLAVNANVNHLSDEGYRDNNHLKQDSGQIAFHMPLTQQTDLYLKLDTIKQDLELPGTRTIRLNGQNELQLDRKGTNTPNDWADEQLFNSHFGIEHQWNNSSYLVIDGSYRNKQQLSFLFSEYRETTLDTWSLTPRFTTQSQAFNTNITWRIGSDIYYYDYTSDSADAIPTLNQPNSHRGVSQSTIALYGQAVIAFSDKTAVTVGIRQQQMRRQVNDSSVQDFNESYLKGSYSLGIKHAFSEAMDYYFRISRQHRFATIDELFFFDANNNFQATIAPVLPQTSDDIEWGLSYQSSLLTANIAIFHQSLKNEIHLEPISFRNINLDDTQHDGLELSVEMAASKRLSLHANYTYLKAEFTTGTRKENDLPLVPNQRVNLSAIMQLPAKTTMSLHYQYNDATRLANDLNNEFSARIPSYKTWDVKLAKQWQQWQLSLLVNNLFNEKYYNYAVGSTFTPGNVGVYPLAERTVYLNASYQLN